MNNSRVIGNEVCYHSKQSYEVYELFRTRYTLFKQVYTHRAGKAIQCMISDILELADPVLNISGSLNDAADFCNLTDCILKTIETSKEPGLARAQALVRRLRRRDLYTFVDQRLVTEQEQSKLPQISGRVIALQNPNLDESDLILEKLVLNYAFKNENPVDHVSFFSKWDDSTSFRLKKEDVSLLTPGQFSETHLRLFCRDSKKVAEAQKAFRAVLKSFSLTPTQAHFISPIKKGNPRLMSQSSLERLTD
eukprot:TRINITY_DN7122_c0_g1_i1.p1 TRINITY_DN7122_c0_g1~~TRINITY_DN7122_c0_g1_i1.p1  ORF type:complete len:250 (+),score=45.71 TRINITY_DN7122_c0_g1_i1:77-826(+)